MIDGPTPARGPRLPGIPLTTRRPGRSGGRDSIAKEEESERGSKGLPLVSMKSIKKLSCQTNSKLSSASVNELESGRSSPNDSRDPASKCMSRTSTMFPSCPTRWVTLCRSLRRGRRRSGVCSSWGMPRASPHRLSLLAPRSPLSLPPLISAPPSEYFALSSVVRATSPLAVCASPLTSRGGLQTAVCQCIMRRLRRLTARRAPVRNCSTMSGCSTVGQVPSTGRLSQISVARCCPLGQPRRHPTERPSHRCR